MAFAGRWPRFLGKASLFRVPVIGRIITACGQIPVERGTNSAVQALQAAITAIEAGKTVVIYPEGTVTFDEQLWPMVAKSGAARIALQTACPVIPIGQWGAQDIMWGKKVHFPHLLPRKTLRLVAGPPVPLDDLRAAPVNPQAVGHGHRADHGRDHRRWSSSCDRSRHRRIATIHAVPGRSPAGPETDDRKTAT